MALENDTNPMFTSAKIADSIAGKYLFILSAFPK
jgi:hypothetical protein